MNDIIPFGRRDLNYSSPIQPYPAQTPVVVQPPSAESVLAETYPELAISAMQQVVGQNVANMAMASGCAPRNLSDIEISNTRSWFTGRRTTRIRFRR